MLKVTQGRREFLKMLSLLGAAGIFGTDGLVAAAAEFGETELPFAKGRRRIVPTGSFPEKGEMLLQRMRPPLLETPYSVLEEHIFTPNDQFYVRWHMGDFPTKVDVETYRIRVFGEVQKPFEISLKELINDFKPVELTAVNQCAGNSRGFIAPRTPGAQWAHGAMGNALWTGVPLNVLLERAGVKSAATHVAFRSLEMGAPPFPPDTRFEKVLTLEDANDSEVMVSYAMNGQPMPLLNGFPVRLVVPGWYSTYWIKMLTEIEVLNQPGKGYFISRAYLIPDTPGGCMSPGEEGVKMVPVNKMNPRSFFAGIRDGASLAVNQQAIVKGFAFGGSTGLAKVLFSSDDGVHWQEAALGHDYGKYSFRTWETNFTPRSRQTYTLMVKAVNTGGQEQPLKAGWNPGGYLYNAIERISVNGV